LKILVCGGREYNDWRYLWDQLDKIDIEEGITLIIEGGATGVDRGARLWAESKEIPFLHHPARWKSGDNFAGPRRNREMIQWEPDLVVAFPGGRGTNDMVKVAKAAKIKVKDLR
jgi:hypothetical protein